MKRIAPYVQDIAKQARTVDVEVIFKSAQRPRLLTGYSADIEIILDKKPTSCACPPV